MRTMQPAAGVRTADLWHATGRAARDERKRLVSLVGVAASVPLLWVGAVAWIALLDGPPALVSHLRNPLATVLGPVESAYWDAADLRLLGYVCWQGLLLTLWWGAVGGRLYRLAVVHLATGTLEEGRAAAVFARRRWLLFAGARLILYLAVLVPCVAAVLLALPSRLPDPWGSVLTVPGAVGALLAATATIWVLAPLVMGGFLTGPVIAAEDGDLFHAVTRPWVYVRADLPRLTGLRLLFGAGVLLGSGWRLLRIALVAVLGLCLVRVGAGEARLDRALSLLQAMGVPPDADRLGVGWGDAALALALAGGGAALVSLFLADLISRVVCARAAVYLLIRRSVEGIALDRLRAWPRPRALSPEEAGFVELHRVPGREPRP